MKYFLLTLGVFFMVLAGYEFSWRSALTDDGEEIFARVTNWRDSSDKHGDSRFEVQYEFTPAVGDTTYRRVGVFGRDNLWSTLPEDEWRQAKSDRKLKVIYERADPSNNLPLSELPEGSLNLWLIFLFGFLFASYALYSLWSAENEKIMDTRNAQNLRGKKEAPLVDTEETTTLTSGTYDPVIVGNPTIESDGEVSETFPVDWKSLFRSLSIFISVMIILPVILIMGIRFFKSGFDYQEAFGSISLGEIFVILASIVAFSAGFSFFIASWLRLARITITNGEIHGRNFWGFRNSIPLSEISDLTGFSSNGINAIVVESRDHGKVFISERTERLPELLSILEKHLPESDRFLHPFSRR